MEILSHVNKRVKHQKEIPLPLLELWRMYREDNFPSIVRNFCIVYIEMAFDRSTLEVSLSTLYGNFKLKVLLGSKLAMFLSHFSFISFICIPHSLPQKIRYYRGQNNICLFQFSTFFFRISVPDC